MNLTKIISISLLVIALGLAYFLVNSISSAIEEEEKIVAMEAKVINKLIMIRRHRKATKVLMVIMLMI